MSLLNPSLFAWRWTENWVLDPTLGLEVPKVITMATLGGFVCGTFFVAVLTIVAGIILSFVTVAMTIDFDFED